MLYTRVKGGMVYFSLQSVEVSVCSQPTTAGGHGREAQQRSNAHGWQAEGSEAAKYRSSKLPSPFYLIQGTSLLSGATHTPRITLNKSVDYFNYHILSPHLYTPDSASSENFHL